MRDKMLTPQPRSSIDAGGSPSLKSTKETDFFKRVRKTWSIISLLYGHG